MMAEVKWTENQKLAIKKTNTNILVSAGAGSGKTAVLSERIKRKVEQGIGLDELLVLTFSNASAHDMKAKIKKNILNTPSIAHLAKDVDSANISTFDSYALLLVKQYSYILGIDPNLSIVEKKIIDIEKNKILDEIMEELYANPSAKFDDFATKFFVKNDDSFKTQLLKIYNNLDRLYDKKTYLSTYIEKYFDDGSYLKKCIQGFENYVLELVSDFKFVVENEIYPFVEKEIEENAKATYEKLFEASTYDDIAVELNGFRHPGFSDVDDELKNKIKKIKTTYFEPIKKIAARFSTINDIKAAISSTKPYVEIIIDLLNSLDERIVFFKESHALFEFNDIAKYAIKILDENELIREELKKKYKEILIDEYQDTSDLQEKFVSLIADNNVYMVGDLKQSIYRFRNANPQLFKTKYDTFCGNEKLYDSLPKEEQLGFKIDLTDNFRSRNEVVNTINLIFSQIMNEEVGGVNYKRDHQMIHGNKTYDSYIGKLSHQTEVLTYDYDKEKDINRSELEIRIIANDIVSKIKNGYEVYDSELKALRPASLKDFSILVSTGENYEKIQKIFKEYNLETNIHKNENINTSTLILVLKNMLTLAIKVYLQEFDTSFNYAFTSIARSFLFEYSDNQIFDYIVNKTYIESDIITKIQEVSNELPYNSLSNVLGKILYVYDFYDKLTKIDDLQLNLTRTEYFVSLCDNLEALSIPLNDVPEYLANLLEGDKGPELKGAMKDIDAVVVMTIHKSKGLEYPVVYLPFLTKGFNKQDLNDSFLFDNTYGIITPYYQEGVCPTIYKDLLKREYTKELISERNRLFYVALTRAKEKLIFIYENKKEDLKILPIKINSFDHLLSQINSKLNNFKIVVDKENLKSHLDIKKEKSKTKEKTYIVKDLSIKGKVVETSRASKINTALIDERINSNMQMGLHIHEILEYIDYNNPDEILNFENNWVKQKIYNFLNSFIFNNKENNEYYREYAFSFKDEDNTYNGIIDLLVETPKHIYIVDYKLKHVTDDAYIKQLSIYNKFIATKSNKPISTYLYSILDGEFKEINIKEEV